jgi:hypothetical protein
MLKVGINQRSLHDFCFGLTNIHRSLKHNGMSHTLHTVFNEELEGVAVLIHVEVASMNLGDDVADVTGGIKLC